MAQIQELQISLAKKKKCDLELRFRDLGINQLFNYN